MVDIIVTVADRDVERITMHNDASSFLLLEQGRKIEALAITDHTGGGAINAAVSMARLGHDVSALIKIGHDRDGERICARLDHEGISRDCIVCTNDLPTGTAVMVSSHDRNATIFTQRGANTLLTPDDLHDAAFADRDLVYVTNLSNRSADCFPDIVRLARASGAFVAVNPGIRQLTSRTQALADSLSDIDLLALNAVEAASLVPMIRSKCGDDRQDLTAGAYIPKLARVGLEFGGFEIGLRRFAEEIRKLGVGTVVVTDGSDGAYLSNDDGLLFCPTLSADVKGTAGAGDAFISTVSASLVKGYSPADALRRGAINAASVVSEIDAQSGLLSADAMTQRMKETTGDLTVVAIP